MSDQWPASLATLEFRAVQTTTPGRRTRRVRRSPLAYVLPIHVAQVVVWQLAVLAAIAWFRPVGPRTVVVLAVCGLAVLATSVRVGGQCGYQWLATWIAFRRRREAAALLHVDLRTHTDRLGNRTGLAGVGGTWSAAIRLRDSGGVDTSRLAAVLNDYVQRSETVLAAAQLVIRTAPFPDGPERAFWLAVRYDPALGPLAARARGGGELGALRTTASAAHRLARLLDDAGFPGAVLDERALREQLSFVAGTSSTREAKETWRQWTVWASRQRCYRPSYGVDPRAVLDRYAAGAAFTCVSYTLRRPSRGAAVAEVLVRVGDGERYRLGVPLDSLHGRHAAAARATLPLALGLGRAG